MAASLLRPIDSNPEFELHSPCLLLQAVYHPVHSHHKQFQLAQNKIKGTEQKEGKERKERKGKREGSNFGKIYTLHDISVFMSVKFITRNCIPQFHTIICRAYHTQFYSIQFSFSFLSLIPTCGCFSSIS